MWWSPRRAPRKPTRRASKSITCNNDLYSTLGAVVAAATTARNAHDGSSPSAARCSTRHTTAALHRPLVAAVGKNRKRRAPGGARRKAVRTAGERLGRDPKLNGKVLGRRSCCLCQPAPQASRRFAHAAHAERAAHAAESDASTRSDNVLASHRAPPRSSRVAPCVTELVQRRPPATSQKARPSKSSYQRPRVLVGDGPHAGAPTNTACGARAVMETAAGCRGRAQIFIHSLNLYSAHVFVHRARGRGRRRGPADDVRENEDERLRVSTLFSVITGVLR